MKTKNDILLESLKKELEDREKKLTELEESGASDSELVLCEELICKTENIIKTLENEITKNADFSEKVKEIFNENFKASIPSKTAYYAMVNGHMFQYKGKSIWGKKGCLLNALVSYCNVYHNTFKGVDIKNIINNLIKENFIKINEVTI